MIIQYLLTEICKKFNRMKIDKINCKIYLELLIEERKHSHKDYIVIEDPLLLGYRISLVNYLMWINRSKFQKLIEKAVSREISISVFFDCYFDLYFHNVTSEICKYEDNLIAQGKSEFQKIKTVNFCYPQHIEILNEFDFRSRYDEYEPDLKGITSFNSFSMSSEDVRIDLELILLPYFQTYENIEFEIRNQTFTISKFFSETYTKCLFVNCTFKNVTFDNQIFTNCKFVSCEFNDIRFMETNIKECCFKECTLINVFWDTGLILESKFDECNFQKNESLSFTCTNTTFKNDMGWITISLDGFWEFGDFLDYVASRKNIF